jgi:Protein of unknown function DUF262/Restriction Enzyme Adenine Methylase Associated
VADSPVEGSGLTIEQLFSGRRYSLDYYQREYSWSRDSLELLLGDLQRRFLACWKDTDDRQATARYEPYFLGPYVYHEEEGTTFIVDGQQRITTLHLLLIYLRRLLKDQGLTEDAEQLTQLIYKRQRGRSSFTIDLPERHDLLEALIQERSYELPADCSPSLQNLYDRSRDIDELYPEELRGDALPYFHDWLLDRVCLVGIKALGRENAWEIFESMNNRGVRLGPVDLLKSYLLSRVDASDRRHLNDRWRNMLSRLNGISSNAASDFVKTFLAGHYSSDSTEFIELYSGYAPFHEWVRQNEDKLGLSSKPDFTRFADRLIKSSGSYQMLISSTEVFDADSRLHAIFYNQYNNLGVQLPLIFAALKPEDQISDVRNKAGLVSNYVDYVYVLTMVNNGASNTFIEKSLADIASRLRSCPTSALAQVLGEEAVTLPYKFGGVDSFGLHQNVRQVRYLLARLTAFVETECNRANLIADYLDETRPYEIEHVWANTASYRSSEKATAMRNWIGALLLLPKSDNASLGGVTYEEKLRQYRSQNVLAASLHPDTHGKRGNAGFKKFLKKTGLGDSFRPFPAFGVNAIETRQRLYQRLCELIWSTEGLGFPVTTPTQLQTAPPRRPRTHYGVELSDLLDVGIIAAGTTIYGQAKHSDQQATILLDGRIKVETGEVFGSLSGAGQFVRGTKSCAGWSFWHLWRDGVAISLADIRKEALAKGQVEPRR